MKKLILTLTIGLTALTAHADFGTEFFKVDVNGAITICGAKFQLAIIQTEDIERNRADGNDARKCVVDAKIKLSEGYKRESDKMARKPASKEQFKAYYRKVLVTLDGFEPLDNESRYGYNARQAYAKSAVNEAWITFAIDY